MASPFDKAASGPSDGSAPGVTSGEATPFDKDAAGMSVGSTPVATGGDAAQGAQTAAQRWQRAGNAVKATVRMSARLASLKDQLDDNYVDWKDLEEERILGKGTFAIVTKMSYDPPNGKHRTVAVKQIRTELLHNPYDVKLFVEEVKIMRKLRHKNIVEFYGAGWSKATEEEESKHGAQSAPPDHQLFFMQEYMEGGTMQALVVKAMMSEDKLYSNADALRWALGIAQALEYLHHTCKPAVIHRDLKLENVLLTKQRHSKAEAKVCDFGLARRLESGRRQKKVAQLQRVASTKPAELDLETRTRSQQLSKQLTKWMTQSASQLKQKSYQALEMTAHTGSLGYMAPEVLQGKSYNEKADVFSFGIILFNLFHRNIPTHHILVNGTLKDLEAYAHNVAHGYRPDLSPDVQPEVRSLIQRCWAEDPQWRPSMAEVVKELEALQPPPGSEPSEDEDGCCCTIM